MTLKFAYASSIQGRGSKSRVLLKHAAVDCDFTSLFETPFIQTPFHQLLDWHTEQKPELQKTFPLVNLPYLIDENETTGEISKVGGEFPILHYLSAKLGYYGENSAEKAAVLSLSDYLVDMDKSCLSFQSVYAIPKTEPRHPAIENVKNVLMPKFLKNVENQIKSSGKVFSVSDTVSLADILLVLVVHKFRLFWKSVLKGFPEVERVYLKLMANERIRSQVEAEFLLPVTAQYAQCLKIVKNH